MSEEVGKFSCPAAFLVFLITVATIAGAWGFQLIGGYIPCPLCLQQRWPYYIVIPIALAVFLFSRTGGARWFVRSGLVICGLVMLVSAGMGGYHAAECDDRGNQGDHEVPAGEGQSCEAPLDFVAADDIQVIQIRQHGIGIQSWSPRTGCRTFPPAPFDAG